MMAWFNRWLIRRGRFNRHECVRCGKPLASNSLSVQCWPVQTRPYGLYVKCSEEYNRPAPPPVGGGAVEWDGAAGEP